MKHSEYKWIDEFISSISSYVFVRTDDFVLIKKPNQVQKLNKTGAQILHLLLSGEKIEKLFSRDGFNEDMKKETVMFLLAVKQSLEGSLDIFTCNPAVEISEFKTPFTTLPVLSELAITSRCNLKCSFCYAGINCNRISREKELNTKELQRLIEKIKKEAKVPSISFSGGEPTIRKDLPQLIKFAKKLGMRANLISNGTLMTEKLVGKIKAAGLDTAQISIESSKEELHDLIVGKAGSFQRAIEGIRNLVNAGIPVHGNTTLNSDNAADVINLPEFYRSMNLERFSMNLVIPTGSTKVNTGTRLSYEIAAEIVEKVRRKSIEVGIEFMWYSPFPLKLYNTVVSGLGNKGCAACDGLLSVNSAGQVIPCASWEKPMGNLLEQSFFEIWNSEESVCIRHKKKAPAECRDCDHFNVCQGACPLYWEIFGTREIEIHCLKKSTHGRN